MRYCLERPVAPFPAIDLSRLVAGVLPAQERPAAVPASDFRLLAGCSGFAAFPTPMTRTYSSSTDMPGDVLSLYMRRALCVFSRSVLILSCYRSTLPGSDRARLMPVAAGCVVTATYLKFSLRSWVESETLCWFDFCFFSVVYFLFVYCALLVWWPAG